MIVTKSLTKLYDSKNGIQDLNLNIKKGSIFGFLGKNGSGKTTTIRVLTCLLEPDSGDAFIAGYNIKENPLAIRKLTGYLPESVSLYGDLSAMENLEYAARLYGIEKQG